MPPKFGNERNSVQTSEDGNEKSEIELQAKGKFKGSGEPQYPDPVGLLKGGLEEGGLLEGPAPVLVKDAKKLQKV